jgi:hypothetical protein
LESPLHHLRSAPAFNASDRLDGFLNRPHIVFDLFPTVAGEDHLLATAQEVDGDATVVRLSLSGIWQPITPKWNVRREDDMRSPKQLYLSEQSVTDRRE